MSRLRNLGALDMDIGALDLLLVQKRWSSFEGSAQREERKLVEISEPRVGGREEGGAGKTTARKIFTYEFRTKRFVSQLHHGRAVEKICRAFSLTERSLGRELLHREKYLMELSGLSQGEFFNAVHEYRKAH